MSKATTSLAREITCKFYQLVLLVANPKAKSKEGRAFVFMLANLATWLTNGEHFIRTCFTVGGVIIRRIKLSVNQFRSGILEKFRCGPICLKIWPLFPIPKN